MSTAPPDTPTPLLAVVYVSTATHLLDNAALESLLSDARQRNREAGITGVLLYNDGNFMQYLEGPALAVDVILARIQASRRHKDIIELMHEPIAARMFPAWHMGLTQPTTSNMLRLSTAQWPLTAGKPQADSAATMGLQLLHNFWHSAQH